MDKRHVVEATTLKIMDQSEGKMIRIGHGIAAVLLTVAVLPLRGVQHRAVVAEVPAILAAGVRAYKANGAGAAVRAWLAGSPILRNAELVNRTTSSLHEIEGTYGAFEDLELIQTAALGSRVQRHYVMLLYARGPLYARFDSYLTAEGSKVITAFLFDPKPDLIVPPKVL